MNYSFSLFLFYLLFNFIQTKQIISNSVSISSNSIPSYFNIAIIYAIEKNGAPSPTIPYFHSV